jgi:hypothetical protein
MYQKFIHFIKYNNAAVLLLALVFLLGASTFAAAPAGQELIGQKTSHIEGVDNKLLLEADLDKLDMDFKISKIEEDSEYYYVTYTLITLIEKNKAWQYEMQEKTKKISKKLEKDLGLYLADKFQQEQEQIVADLKREKDKAVAKGPEVRQEVTEYSGLIGKALDVSAKVFPGYEPVKKVELASPETYLTSEITADSVANSVSANDNMADVYQQYVATHDLPLLEQASTTVEVTASGTPEALLPDVIVATTTDVAASGTVEIIN